MHSLLEEYLGKVNAHLWALPRARRADELREMRTHLARLTADAMEKGQSEEEATRSAIHHFGSSQTVGKKVSRAWTRGLLVGGRDSILGTSLLAGALLYLPMILFSMIFPSRVVAPGHIIQTLGPLWLGLGWTTLVSGFVGWKLSSRSAGLIVIAAVCTAAFGSVLLPFISLPVNGGMSLPSLTLAPLSFLPSGLLARTILFEWATLLLYGLPAAFAGRFWAGRRSSKA